MLVGVAYLALAIVLHLVPVWHSSSRVGAPAAADLQQTTMSPHLGAAHALAN